MNGILLVDDDSVCNFILDKMLKRLGIDEKNIQSALNGQQAINLLSKSRATRKDLPKFIFLDINMPVMDGFEFIDALNNFELENQYKPKVIIVSSSDDPEDISRAKKMGIVNYLVKPVSEEKLKAILFNE